MDIEFIEKYGMLEEGDRVLCAVSGGEDSMCLLAFLWENSARLGISVAAAHYNHCLRGEESERDERFVASWCSEHGIALKKGRGDVRSYAETHSMSLEEAARELRYEFLENAAAELGCSRIATAHNADDNAETVLMNLARGAGAKGLCGIPPVRGKFIRPLLSVTRAEIEDYNRLHGIPHVEDSTNAADDYTRNILRHRIMPVLREINPSLSRAVLRSGESLREDEDCLAAMARDFAAEYYTDSSLPVKELNELPRAVRMRALRLICGRGLSRAHAEAVEALCEGSGLRHADISGGRVTRDGGRLRFFTEEPEALGEKELPIGAPVEFGDYIFLADISEGSDDISGSLNKLVFNYGKICGSIRLTARRDGDKLSLSHRRCTKSLKELCREAQLSRRERQTLPVLRDSAGIIAVPRFGVDKRCLPEKGDTILRIIIKKR